MRISSKTVILLASGLCLLPASAHAHTVGNAIHGWHDGFAHPLHGWDHLLAMIAIGIWAAQHRGRAVWAIPSAFVSVMLLGSAVGLGGLPLPGVEIPVTLSVAVLGWLVLRRVMVRPGVGACLAGFFAFFHGYAHGAEVPAATSALTFGVGFLIATVLLHAAGWLTARTLSTVAACFVGTTVSAQTPAPDSSVTHEVTELPEMIVMGRADSLVGVATSAAQGTVGAVELAARPTARVGELLETVPGVIITQHAGGGKANQYFLRGFNLDHGTDFATSLDGMPVNLPTHGHGQGYTDMNIVIPELVQRINYEKGLYYADNGDFASAGAAHLESFQTLPQALAVLEGGMYGYGRAMFASSPKLGGGHLLYGLEAYHHDGPWKNPDDYQRFNGVTTYSHGDSSEGYSVTARAYHGKWDSSDQVATSAVDTGLVPFFSSLDDTTGGHSQRYSLQAEWHRADAASATKIMAYGFYYDLDLFSNFTYWLTDTNRGDQFEQADKRWVSGLNASHTWYGHWGKKDVENTFGLQFRNDSIRNGLYQTQARQRVDKINVDDGSVLPATTRQDDVLQTSVGMYAEDKIQWSDWFRTVVGIRGDVYGYNVDSLRTENSGNVNDAVGSPKVGLVFGPWSRTEVYVQGGMGFHSNDGRGVTTHVDPVTGSNFDGDGNPIHPADPLARSYGAEIGVRTTAVEGLQSTVSLWWLDIDSELLFVGDAGTTEASRPSRRYGVEWANFYHLTKELVLDADVSFSHAEFRDDDPAGRKIPGAIESVVATGLTYTSAHGFFGSLRLRYFGPRPLVEDDSFRSGETILLGAQLGYRLNDRWTVTADLFNLLDRRDHDIDYAYESRVSPTADSRSEVHFHPVEPIQARFALTARF